MTDRAQPAPSLPLTPAATADRAKSRTVASPGGARLLLFRTLAVTLAVLLPLLMLEAALRLFGPFLPGNYDTGPYVRRHPTLGHFHTPNFGGWIKTAQFTVRIDINPMGLRDPRTSYAKPPGTFRVLALGDSYVEAAQVQAHETVAARMERQLSATLGRSVEVINGGVFGYGTTQELLLLEQEGLKYQPDLVVLFFCHCNDLANNNWRLELIDGDLHRALKPYYDLERDGSLRLLSPPPPSSRTNVRMALRNHSMLYNVIETGVVYKLELQNPREAFNGVDGLVDPVRGKYDYRPDDEWERSWQITDRLLARVRDVAARAGAPVAIVGIPEWRMLERAYWRRDANKRLVDSGRGGPDALPRLLDGIAQRHGIPHLDLYPVFQPGIDADGLFAHYLESDFHWTAAGHVVAAEAVGAFLLERGLISR